MTLLHVEDDPELAYIVEYTFRTLGFHGLILNASTVSAALRILESRTKNSEPVDLVVLDFNLPDGSGFEVLRRVKTNPVWLSIPVLMLTSEVGNGTIAEAYALGANCYLPKTETSFLNVIEQLYHYWLTTTRLPKKRKADIAREVFGRTVEYKIRLSRFYGGIGLAFSNQSEQSKFWLERALVEGNHANLFQFLMQIDLHARHFAEPYVSRLWVYMKEMDNALTDVERSFTKNPTPAMEDALHWALDIQSPFDPGILVAGLSDLFPDPPAAASVLLKSMANQLRELANMCFAHSTDSMILNQAESLRNRADALEHTCTSP
jgi:CheY-like chemotaxis protein